MEISVPTRKTAIISDKWKQMSGLDPLQVYSWTKFEVRSGYTYLFIEEIQAWKPDYLFEKFDLCLN